MYILTKSFSRVKRQIPVFSPIPSGKSSRTNRYASTQNHFRASSGHSPYSLNTNLLLEVKPGKPVSFHNQIIFENQAGQTCTFSHKLSFGSKAGQTGTLP